MADSTCSGKPVVSVCGETSEINTSDSTTCVDPCTTTPETCATDCCDNTQTAAPAPYYTDAPICQESHVQQVIQKQFYTTLKISTAWNVPECGGQATIKAPDAKQVLPGSFLWNPTYGYFEIISFNASTYELVVQNNCNTGNEAPGTQVPACTDFLVTDSPIDPNQGQTDIFPYVALDFLAPAMDNCIDISVTTVNGLSVGKNVQIGSGTYLLDAVLDATTITICNEGSGITPGTPVIAKNAAGEYQYPIILIDANPCTNTAISQGSILVCKNSITQPLEATILGSIPVVIDVATNEVEYKILDLPTRTCTALIADLTLVTGQASYTLTVADSSQFTVGDIAQIGSRTDRLTITAVPDATHLQGTLDPVPGSIQNIDAGTSVCLVGCCELVQEDVDTLLPLLTPCSAEQDAALQLGLYCNQDIQTDVGSVVLTSGSPTANSNPATLVVNNPSTCRDMQCLCQASVMTGGEVAGAFTALTEVAEGIGIQIDGGGYPVVPYALATDNIYTIVDTPVSKGMARSYGFQLSVPAGTSRTVDARAQLIFGSGGASSYTIESHIITLAILGVAI